MKKNTILFCFILSAFSSHLSSQIGINTPSPKSTMDVDAARNSNGQITNNSQWIGLQAPRISLAELTASTASYAMDQAGSLVYITNISGGNTSGQRINITSPGYYYFNGSIWQKIKDNSDTDINIYAQDGSLTTNRTITENMNTLTFTGTANGGNKFINSAGTSALPKSPLQIVDGGQAAGKVLMSDTNGNASWQTYRLQKVSGTIGTGTHIPFTATNFRTTGTSITLPPGKWEVNVTMLLPVYGGTLTSSDWIWLKSSFADTNTNIADMTGLSADISGSKLVSGLFSGAKGNTATPKFDVMVGSIIINNTTTSNKIYYYVAGFCDRELASGTGKATRFENFGGSEWSENIITANPVL
ncbi:hypothetical protein [Chryseobacterium sp.]|uniref:hypothetical protein n=1 Tax=Chryseobacterium sp. TaxID=1871047 RepID=UPI00321BACA0